ncbi:MAG: transposase [Gammaproteobacteria bacterium]|nr:transposase [Gammaproteobacteria bacterium]
MHQRRRAELSRETIRRRLHENERVDVHQRWRHVKVGSSSRAVLCQQCLDRRIAERAELESEIAVWERRRNANREKIQWMFNCEKACEKLAHAYTQLISEPNILPHAA